MSQLGAKVLCQGDWWAPDSVVRPPNAGGRSFTFITRHQLPDGQPAPCTEPAEVVAALERLELRPLTTTVVAAPNASGGGAAEREAVELEVVDLGPKGCGLVPLRDLAAGEPVADYLGEIVSTEEAEVRQKRCDEAGGMNYLLVLREHVGERCVRTSIDPTAIGGVARTINHSCAPNLACSVVRDCSLVPAVRFSAAQPIRAGTELTFDYEDLFGAEPAGEKAAGGDAAGRTACLCGAPSCRGRLPFTPLG